MLLLGTVTNGIFDTTYTVEYTTNGACPTTSSQTFTVFSEPIIFPPTALEVCDDGTPDGITSIDLTLKNVEVTGGNSDYSVTYYGTQADADAQVNALPIPYTNQFNGQVVVVLVTDITTGCTATTTLELIVEQAPVANVPTPLEYCDPDADGFGVFDLTSKDLEVTGGDPTLTVSYHETMADAMNNVNALVSPYNNIVEDMQTVYVRVESSTIATDCETIVELVLIVNPTPQLGAAPTPLEICDDLSADGFGQFDLTSKEGEILQNLADPSLYTVTYYESEANADVPTLAIGTPGNYTNTMAFNQTVWVRVEDNVTGCYQADGARPCGERAPRTGPACAVGAVRREQPWRRDGGLCARGCHGRDTERPDGHQPYILRDPGGRGRGDQPDIEPVREHGEPADGVCSRHGRRYGLLGEHDRHDPLAGQPDPVSHAAGGP